MSQIARKLMRVSSNALLNTNNQSKEFAKEFVVLPGTCVRGEIRLNLGMIEGTGDREKMRRNLRKKTSKALR